MKKKMSYLTFYALTRIIIGMGLCFLFTVIPNNNKSNLHFIIAGIFTILLIVCLIIGRNDPDEMDKEKILLSKSGSVRVCILCGIFLGLGKYVPFLDSYYTKKGFNFYQHTALLFILIILVSESIFVLIEEKRFQAEYKYDDDFSKIEESEGSEEC